MSYLETSLPRLLATILLLVSLLMFVTLIDVTITFARGGQVPPRTWLLPMTILAISRERRESYFASNRNLCSPLAGLQRLGPPRLGGLPSRHTLQHALWRKRYGCDTAYCILALKCRDDGVHVIAVFLSDRGAVPAYFLNEGISTHNQTSISSSGVQMTGGRTPALWHVSSIFPRMAALAKCRRFQVRR